MTPMGQHFPLFRSPLDLAHNFWEQLLQPGDMAVDATAGNGRDTLFLARLPLKKVYAIDIQESACANTKALLEAELNENERAKVEVICQSHSSFPREVEGAKLFVYNLGYLPGGDKNKTTMTQSTLQSLEAALSLVATGGAISLTCYPGHPEGAKEEEHLLTFVKGLSKEQWCVTHIQFANRTLSPSLLIIQKGEKDGTLERTHSGIRS